MFRWTVYEAITNRTIMNQAKYWIFHSTATNELILSSCWIGLKQWPKNLLHETQNITCVTWITLFFSEIVFLLKELDSLEDKSETEEWKCKERWKDDRREEKSNQTGEERERRWQSRDPDDQSRRSRSTSPSKWIHTENAKKLHLFIHCLWVFHHLLILSFPPSCPQDWFL